MAQYTGLSSVHSGILGEYELQGFELQSPDDHVLILSHQGTRVAVFSQTATEIPYIRTACRAYLEKLERSAVG